VVFFFDIFAGWAVYYCCRSPVDAREAQTLGIYKYQFAVGDHVFPTKLEFVNTDLELSTSDGQWIIALGLISECWRAEELNIAPDSMLTLALAQSTSEP